MQPRHVNKCFSCGRENRSKSNSAIYLKCSCQESRRSPNDSLKWKRCLLLTGVWHLISKISRLSLTTSRTTTSHYKMSSMSWRFGCKGRFLLQQSKLGNAIILKRMSVEDSGFLRFRSSTLRSLSSQSDGDPNRKIDIQPILPKTAPANPEVASKQQDPITSPDKSAAVEKPATATPMQFLRDRLTLDRNFITPLRAMNDFLLTPQHLEGMRKTLRRSAHADEPPITVYWRKDIQAKAMEVWGSLDALNAEKRRRDQMSSDLHEATFEIRKIMRQYGRKYPESETPRTFSNLMSGSGRIVVTAVAINGSNFVMKLVAWILTGSHSLFAEAIHSLADTINQLILVYGIHKSTQKANVDHPYGYANMRHVASLVSGVGIFCVGAGLSFYHGIVGLIVLEPVQSLYWAFYILGGSLVSEGATYIMAVNEIRKRSKELNISAKDFVLRSVDPALNVVLMEDTAALAGVVVAGSCMGLTTLIGSPIPDAVGSLIIGGILGGVASFIIYSNATALVGRSIPRENLNRINFDLEQDIMVRAVHDVKGIDMGNSLVRYKAEVDFDGRELTRAYLEKQNVMQMLEEVRAIQSKEEFEQFILKHGEGIVDTLGAEIDRIEKRLKRGHPEIRHCDLEIL